MARPLRIQYPGALYHITSRGNARQPIFQDDSDRRAFLAVLEIVVDREQWRCHAYCLMGNHYHLVVETPEGNLSAGMRRLNGTYTRRFNRRHERVGHLFQGRFHSVLAEKQGYLLELGRYVVLNPVRAGIVEAPGDYIWSSYRAMVGSAPPPRFLTRRWLLSQFGEDERAARMRFRDFVCRGIGEPSPWDASNHGTLVGSRAFVAELEPFLERAADVQEVPKVQRRGARPELGELFAGSGPVTRRARDEFIARACLRHRYSQVEVARYLGLHYSTVSRVVRREYARFKT